ncbi:MAG: hypothetical protein NVS3B20_11400 [Polyangiales bacterium]
MRFVNARSEQIIPMGAAVAAAALVFASIAACGKDTRPIPATPIAVGPSGGDVWAPAEPKPAAAPSAMPSSAASASSPTLSSTASTASTAAGLKEGDAAPILVATASNGTKVDLASLKGKSVVVYFYPKDDTPGCTKEACAFRDAWTKLAKSNVVVIGVSHDDEASHKAFAEKYKLPFPLVADTDFAISKRFGVPIIKDTYSSRVSFLIGTDGKIKKIYPKVDPAVHADQILADASGAKSG